MIHKHLGQTIDIHCGGQDLIFPHHENEIAQSECCTGKEYAHYWMHNGYINVDNKKMSKSLGNFFTVREVADDLNTADAISALFDLVRDINTFLASPKAKEPMEYAAQQFDRLADVLGLLYNRKKESLDDEIEELIAQRQQARKEKNFALADKIRDDLKARGIVLLDTPQGVKWKMEQ